MLSAALLCHPRGWTNVGWQGEHGAGCGQSHLGAPVGTALSSWTVGRGWCQGRRAGFTVSTPGIRSTLCRKLALPLVLGKMREGLRVQAGP